MANTLAAAGGTSHRAELTGLAPGQTCTEYVRCQDAAGNENPSSYAVTFRVASAGAAHILWRDSIQDGRYPWGFGGIDVQRPIGMNVDPSDANGANLSRVPDPAGGSGYALRHVATFDYGGSRSQAGIYGDYNTAFGVQAKRPEGVWVAQEWYFPEALTANGDHVAWVSVWDWHSITSHTGSNRWHTAPGIFLATDGSMRVSIGWGGPARGKNPPTGESTIALPVGRWFDMEMHYQWVATKTGTVSLWVDGQLALEQNGVQTCDPSHRIVETYVKFYGSTGQDMHWSPMPSIRYTRNVRVAGERIWR